jgi:DNA-binding MarR family transcriptional regulator
VSNSRFQGYADGVVLPPTDGALLPPSGMTSPVGPEPKKPDHLISAVRGRPKPRSPEIGQLGDRVSPIFLNEPCLCKGFAATTRRLTSGRSMPDIDFKSLPPFHSTEQILAHPRFPHARDEFVKAMLALYEHKPLLNRLLLEASRTVLVSIIMCLFARYDEDDRTTWPTLRLIADSMAEHRLASASRVHDLVRRLVKAGYLEQRAVPQDRRVRILIPTAKMIAQDQDFLVSHHLPLQILFPDPGYALIMTRDAAFQLKQRLVSRDLFALGAQILASNPIMMLFQGRDAGVMVLIKMIEMAGREGGARPLGVSYSDLGSRFGVSRTHVRELLMEAEKMNLVRLSSGSGRFVEMTPQLLQAFDRLIADAMSGFDLCYQLALR